MTVISRTPARVLVLVVALLGLLALQTWAAAPAHAAPAPSYDSIPDTLPPSWPSLGYQATQTSEFGDLIELAGTDRDLDSITVGLVDWACEFGGDATCVTTPGATWTHPITVNVYAVGTAPLPGALLATVTRDVEIPYRPSADPTNCGDGATKWFDATEETCQNGFAFTAAFDFSSLLVSVPDRIIVSVAYDTQTYGAAPIGTSGPYNSLNVAVDDSDLTVGTDVDEDSMYWNTSTAAWYKDGGTAGTGLFREDDGGWAGYGLAIEVNTYDILSTLPFDPGPSTGGGSAGGLPTLAATGSEPSPWTGIAGLAAVLLGLGLVVAAPRRGVHRA